MIPRIVHQLWLGEAFPSWVTAASAHWRELSRVSGFEYRLWTLQNSVGPITSAIALGTFHGLSWRGIADLARVEAVSLYGGIYFDVDLVPLVSLEQLASLGDPWVVTTPESTGSLILCNGAFGASPNSPMLEHVRAYAHKNLSRGKMNEHFVAGPRAYRYASEQVEVTEVPALTMKASAAERRIRAAGEAFDIGELRACRPEGTLIAHIGLPLGRGLRS